MNTGASLEERTLTRRDFIKITAIAGGLLAGGSTLKWALGSRPATVEDSRYLMGTIINLTLIAESEAAGRAAVEAAYTELESLIGLFDHRLPGSPLGQLNQNGVLADPPPELTALLREALSFAELSGGAFDISVKPVVDALAAGKTDISGELKLVDYRQIAVRDDLIRFSRAGMQVTLDGIAKGRVVDAGVAALKAHGFDRVLVEAGGDLFAQGTRTDTQPWTVAIQNPRQSKGDPWLASLKVAGQAVATSGDYMHAFSTDYSLNHIIDPRVGRSPAELCAATVIAPSTMQADALSTSLMVLGVDAGLALANHLNDVEALLITKDMERLHTAGFPSVSLR